MPICTHCGKTTPQPRYSLGEQKGDEYTRDVTYECVKPPGCGFSQTTRVTYQGSSEFLARFASYQPKREAKSGEHKTVVHSRLG